MRSLLALFGLALVAGCSSLPKVNPEPRFTTQYGEAATEFRGVAISESSSAPRRHHFVYHFEAQPEVIFDDVARLRWQPGGARSSTGAPGEERQRSREAARRPLARPDGPAEDAPPMPEPEAVTQLLRRAAAGDAAAQEELFPLVYGELHGLARGYMAAERAEHTLQPTALIHETWLRMSGETAPEWQGRGHFLALAARAMRRVLIDHARRRGARKREGGEREGLDAAVALFEEEGPDLVVLDEALTRLAALDPELGRIVELRYFGGASNEEIARALEVSTRTVERGWKTAQTWLRAELSEDAE